MDEAERVLAECAAAPHDDEPRLVWADLVGGERGELVVLQCDLARGGLPPAEVAARRRRERALLDEHAVAWAGPIARLAPRWSFRRGFVEAARLELAAVAPHLLDAVPLLRALTVERTDEAEPGALDAFVALAGRLRALALSRDRQLEHDHALLARLADAAAQGRLGELRAFGVAHAAPASLASLRRIVEHAPIDQLRLRFHELEARELARLLDAAPRLAALELATQVPFATVANRPLRALVLPRVIGLDLEALARGRIAESLTYLSLDPSTAPGALERIARFPQLATLDLHGDLASIARSLAALPPLPALRVLRIRQLDGEPTALPTADLARVIGRHGPMLELLELPGSFDETSARYVAGELRVADPPLVATAFGDELLHEAGPGALGRPCCELAPPMSFVRFDVAERFDVPALPADEPVNLGRASSLVGIRLGSGSVARRHLRVAWRDGQRHAHDLGSTNGTIVNGEHRDRVILHDGDRLQLGTVHLQYFSGPGARERADQATAVPRSEDRAGQLARSVGAQFGEACAALARRVPLATPSQLAAAGDALADWYIRGVLQQPELPAIRDAASRAVARARLPDVLGADASPATLLLEALDRLDGAATEAARDACWMALFFGLGAMVRCLERARHEPGAAAKLEETLAALASA